ncbi:MAG: hypothetical protein ABI263_07155, partial [Gelidibacter sp.]
SLMIEKYIKGEVTMTSMENWILTHSLENEYAKPYSGKPFGINRESAGQVIDKIKMDTTTNLINAPSPFKLN